MSHIRNVNWQNQKNWSIAVFVFLFLLIFTPFEIQKWSYPERFYYVLGYGICTLLGMYAWDILKPKIANTISVGSPTRRQIIYSFSVVLIISLFNFIYSFLIGLVVLSLQGFLLFLGITLAVGIFPSLLLYYESSRHREKRAESSSPEIAPIESEAVIQLEGDNQDERIFIEEEDLLFIKAALNYSEVFFLKEGQLKREILRISMNRVEEQLSHDFICRTHRSFICNLKNVDEVNRKNKGLLLSFHEIEETACCSRKYKSVIQKKLGHLKGDSPAQKLRSPLRQDHEYAIQTNSHKA